MPARQARIDVLEAILSGEKELADRLLEDFAVSSGGYRRAMDDVLSPVLEEMGNRWTQEKTSLAQGYVAGKVAELLLLKITSEGTLLNISQEAKGPVVIGNIEDDYHSLGRRMVCIFLRSAGWLVHDLGCDVSPEEFVDKAVETGASIIGVSAMMYTTAGNIRKIRDELDQRNLTGRIMLAVGGAVFKLRPELVDEVGGDGTTPNGYQVPQLFSELRARLVPGEPPR